MSQPNVHSQATGCARRSRAGIAIVATVLVVLIFTPDPVAAATDCRRPNGALEQAICESPDLAEAAAEVDLALARALERQPDPDGLRRQQDAWQRDLIAQCSGSACLLQAHRDRSHQLRQRSIQPLDLRNDAWAPLLSHRIERIDDTRVVHGLVLRASAPTRLHWEFHPDPADDRDWAGPGPGFRVHCHPPDRREGYASRFEFRDRAWGIEFTPVLRAHGRGYILASMTLGTELPLDEDIICAVGFTEWLLDHPSQLHLVATANTGKTKGTGVVNSEPSASLGSPPKN